MTQRQRILQLIAKTKCAAGLVVTAASHQAAGYRLVQ